MFNVMLPSNENRMINCKGSVEAAQSFQDELKGKKFHTILADPAWQFRNRTGKISPENRKNYRYPTLSLEEIKAIPVQDCVLDSGHLYLCVPNALLDNGLEVMKAWGFTYKTNIVWHKIRKDGASDGSGVGFYFRNATELVLFGTVGKAVRTLEAGRTQANLIASRKQGHSRKPDALYDLIERCSQGTYLELFARRHRQNWEQWGNQAESD